MLLTERPLVRTPTSLYVHSSAQQVAKKLGISRQTIMRAIERHKLHAIRDNRNQWLVDDADIAHRRVRSEAAWRIAQATLIPAHPIHEIQMRIAVSEAELRAATNIIDD